MTKKKSNKPKEKKKTTTKNKSVEKVGDKEVHEKIKQLRLILGVLVLGILGTVMYKQVGLLKQQKNTNPGLSVVEVLEYDTEKKELVKVDHKIPALENPIPLWEKYTIEELFEPSGNPVIIYFSAVNCSYCAKQDIVLKALQEETDIEIRRLDKEIHSDIIKKIGIQGYPTTMYMNSDGTMLDVEGRAFEVEGKGRVMGFMAYKDASIIVNTISELE